MRYIVRVSKLQPYEHPVIPYSHIVYDGSDFNKAKRTMTEYTGFSGVSIEIRSDFRWDI